MAWKALVLRMVGLGYATVAVFLFGRQERPFWLCFGIGYGLWVAGGLVLARANR